MSENPIDFKCPRCNNPLAFKQHDTEFECWCDVGRCKSDRANVGTFGKTTTEAYNALCAAVKLEAQ